MQKNSKFYDIQKLIYKDKSYDKAINSILESSNSEDFSLQSLLALAYFYKGEFKKSSDIFAEISDLYSYGYSELLLGNTEDALLIWQHTQPSPAQNWGLFFCELFTDKIVTKPSYLQIRAFLERDLNAFLKFNLVQYVQKIIDVSEFLFDINPETNKFIARAFLYNGYPEYSIEYLNRALDYTDKDAELFYLQGLYYLAVDLKNKAKINFEEALKINNNYIPAKNWLLKLG